MQDMEKFLEESVDTFRAEMESCLSRAASPEDIRWTIFSVGTKEIEEAVLDRLINAFLTNVSGVFIYRPESPEELATQLEIATDKLKGIMAENQIVVASEKGGFVLTKGV